MKKSEAMLNPLFLTLHCDGSRVYYTMEKAAAEHIRAEPLDPELFPDSGLPTFDPERSKRILNALALAHIKKMLRE